MEFLFVLIFVTIGAFFVTLAVAYNEKGHNLWYPEGEEEKVDIQEAKPTSNIHSGIGQLSIVMNSTDGNATSTFKVDVAKLEKDIIKLQLEKSALRLALLYRCKYSSPSSEGCFYDGTSRCEYADMCACVQKFDKEKK